jgi:putative DNA topoisomerase
MKKFLLLAIVLLAASPVLFAQSAKTKTDTTKKQMYTCTMDPEVLSDKPGKCPKCGMTLVPVSKKQSKVYTCPMHPEVVSDKPGKCPKCGMTLMEKKGGHSMDSSIHKMPMHKMDTSMHKMPA